MGKQNGFTLMEIMLSVCITLLASIGVYTMLGRAQVSADVKREQQRIVNLSESIKANFVMERSFESLNHDFLIENISGLSSDGEFFTSAIGKPMEVRPSTTTTPFDSFDIRYGMLDTKLCLRMIRALQSSTSDIWVGSVSVQYPDGRMLSDDAVVSACNASEFKEHQGDVAFRFATPRNTTFGTVGSCTCSPRDEETTGSCSSGDIGTVRYERSSTCSGGTPTCPIEEWTPWTLIESTCAPEGTPLTPHYITPPDTCVSSRTLRSSACSDPSHIGILIYERVANCPGPTLGPWTLVGDTCAPIPPHTTACTPGVLYQPGTCPAGMTGATVEASSSTCASPSASPVWGPWLVVESSCTATPTCLGPPNTCCTPSVEQRAGGATACPAGSFGSGGTTIEQRVSTCPSASATPVWGAWLFHSGTGSACSVCPPPMTSTEQRWQARSDTCPSGETGSITWEVEEEREQVSSYDCSGSPETLPAPTVSPWTAWTETGTTRNLVNTCAPSTPGTRVCSFVSYGSTWTIGSETCNAITASFGLISINEGDSIAISDSSWGLGVSPPKGTARLLCDPVKVQAFLDTAVDTLNHCTTAPDHDACMMLFYGEPEEVLTVIGETCLPEPTGTSCDVPAGTVFNWTVGSNACTFTQPANVSVMPSTNHTVTDSIAPTTGSASFACSSTGVFASSANPGATCTSGSCNQWTPTLVNTNEDDGDGTVSFAFTGSINGIAFNFGCLTGGIGTTADEAMSCTGTIDGVSFTGNPWAIHAIGGVPTPTPRARELLNARGIIAQTYACDPMESHHCEENPGVPYPMFTLVSSTGNYAASDSLTSSWNSCTMSDCNGFEFAFNASCP